MSPLQLTASTATKQAVTTRRAVGKLAPDSASLQAVRDESWQPVDRVVSNLDIGGDGLQVVGGARIIRRVLDSSRTRTLFDNLFGNLFDNLFDKLFDNPFDQVSADLFVRTPRSPGGNSNRRSCATPWAIGLLLACHLGLVGCGRSSSDLPQRVVLITIDTLRADRVGCYGAARAHTPTLDAAAASGVRFETAISPTPLTLPSHTSLMTGLQPPSHGVRHNSIYVLSAEIPTLAEQMRAAGFETAAFVGAAVLSRRFGLDRGFGVYDDGFLDGRMSGTVGYAERPAGAVVDATLDWLGTAPDRFFLWVHFYDPHTDHKPPRGFASAFASDPYAGEIAYVDAQLGRLLGRIRARWGPEQLLLAITSDHGESLGEHGEITHSYTIYEATQRIPLILSGAGLPAGAVVSQLARLIDVAPTLTALSGAPALAPTDGRSLVALIEGDEQLARSAYIETLATQLDHGWSPLIGIRSGRYKFIRAPRPELYDLVRDPAELRNRADVEPDVADRLDRTLTEYASSQNAEIHPAGVAPRPVPEAERRQLESLGYTVPGGLVMGAVASLGVVGGPDPKDEIGVLGVIASAQGAMADGRTADALALLEAQGGSGSVVAAMRAAAALSLRDFERAETDARAVLRVQARRPDIEMILGSALEGNGDVSGALAAYRRSVALDPSAAAPHRGIGRTLQALGDPHGATAAFARARALSAPGRQGGPEFPAQESE
jgi:choline-sulfatase